MNVVAFTGQIKKVVIEENSAIYRDLFDNTKSATDPYWIRALALYNALNESQRDIFIEVLRQTSIDSVSNVFGIIDGVTQLDGQDSDIRLTCGNDDLTGELQDRFLEHFE